MGKHHAGFLKGALQDLVEAEHLVGASKHERSVERTNLRNGYRDHRWDTRVGTLELAIPKRRKGNDMPTFLT